MGCGVQNAQPPHPSESPLSRALAGTPKFCGSALTLKDMTIFSSFGKLKLEVSGDFSELS